MTTCQYCDHELREESGLFNSEANSPEVDFYYCPDCQHTFMDKNQEEELKQNLERVKLQK